eukprot:11023557-Alexandrium_andersonii.AAC.1
MVSLEDELHARVNADKTVLTSSSMRTGMKVLRRLGRRFKLARHKFVKNLGISYSASQRTQDVLHDRLRKGAKRMRRLGR